MFKHPVAFVAVPLALLTAVVAARTAQPEPADTRGTDRLFEIRTYTTEAGKLPALLARFRDHTTRLFEKHGMTNVGYWTPADEPRAADTLIYILAHENRAAAERSWKAFVADPEWHKARDASEADGKIVAKIESVFAKPTDFSPIPNPSSPATASALQCSRHAPRAVAQTNELMQSRAPQ